jgi:hypothetical protein
VEVSSLRETTFHLGSDGEGEWRLKLEPQREGLPWVATLTKRTGPGPTGPNSIRTLETVSNWSMYRWE